MSPYVVTWIHLLAAMTFLGGWMFVLFAVRPCLTEGKNKTPSPDGLEMVKRIGNRFRTIGWVCIVTLILTGASQLLDESGSARIETSWGLIMMLKLFVFAIVGGLVFVHDLILDPFGGAGKKTGEDSATLLLSGKVIWVQRGILTLSLGVLLIAAYLTSI
ncbi:MAG: hypothetical protein AB7T38_03740 [Nitrospirales bacterium]